MSDASRALALIPPSLEEWHAKFIGCLRATGNVQYSAEYCGVSRQRVYQVRQADAEFREQWKFAMEAACDDLELEARRRAKAGSDVLLIFLLKAHRPQIYRDRVQLDVNLVGRMAEQYGLDPEDIMREAEALLKGDAEE